MVSKEPQELRTRLSVSLRPLIFSLLEEEPEATLMAPRLWMTPLRLAPIAPGTRPGRHQQETAEAVGVIITGPNENSQKASISVIYDPDKVSNGKQAARKWFSKKVEGPKEHTG